MNNKNIRLVKGQNVYLTMYPQTNREEAKRFAALFQATWKKLGLDVRRALLSYWRRMNKIEIELLEDWSGWDTNYPLGCIGQVSLAGMNIRFWSTAYAVMPDAPAMFIIAHELMHVYFMAKGRFEDTHNEDLINLCVDEEGFDFEEFCKWSDEHGDVIDRLAQVNIQRRVD